MKTEITVGVWQDGANTETDCPVLLILCEDGETEIQSFTVKEGEGSRRMTDSELEETAAIAFDAIRKCANDVASMPLPRGETNEVPSKDCGASSVPEASELDAD